MVPKYQKKKKTKKKSNEIKITLINEEDHFKENFPDACGTCVISILGLRSLFEIL